DGREALPGKRRNPKLIAGAVVLTLAIAVLAGWMVAHFSGQRTDTGTVALSTADEITDQLAKARVAFSQSDTNTAVEAYKRVLDLDPGNVEATTYAGWLIVTSGVQGEQAAVIQIGIDQLRKAVSLDATYADAHCLLAAALAQYAAPPDLADARAELDTCNANDPPALIRNYIDTQVAPLFDSTDATPPPRPERQASGGGQALADVNIPSSRRSTHVLALRHSGSETISQPRRTSASITSGITSPWLHNTAPSGREANSSITEGKLEPSASRSSMCTGSRSRWASGSRVCTQRTNGLLTSTVTSRLTSLRAIAAA
ncbi:MAG: hypothetical protein ABIR68_09905, partial [Ilumatobacteraceae bacterium]